ncbi:hypothetical protein CNYM01_12608 [Colletotrichum nymphaeae SA-01]|uniref:Uncharacterized protein n=1 Tax=Colletotrichum nymphaeae SA-01 TaxID=1460502 RepID=A0A135SST7_9PEZI|nr:hypothetical protein CNYM01_12608 [Colletotrichum nymphaeae SA-01]
MEGVQRQEGKYSLQILLKSPANPQYYLKSLPFLLLHPIYIITTPPVPRRYLWQTSTYVALVLPVRTVTDTHLAQRQRTRHLRPARFSQTHFQFTRTLHAHTHTRTDDSTHAQPFYSVPFCPPKDTDGQTGKTRDRRQPMPISERETPPSTTRASWQAPALKRCQRSPKVYKTPEPGRTATTTLDQSAPSPDAVIPSKGCATKKTGLTGRHTPPRARNLHNTYHQPSCQRTAYTYLLLLSISPIPASHLRLAPTAPSPSGKQTLAPSIPPDQLHSLHTPPIERHSKSTGAEAVDAIRQLLLISNAFFQESVSGRRLPLTGFSGRGRHNAIAACLYEYRNLDDDNIYDCDRLATYTEPSSGWLHLPTRQSRQKVYFEVVP